MRPKVECSLSGRIASSSLPTGKALLDEVFTRRTRYVEESWDLQQLSKVGTHTDSRISNVEELIDEATNSNEDDANEPSTESACWNGGIVVVIDDSANFDVRRVLHQKGRKWSCENITRNTHNNYQGSLDPQLFVNPLVLDWVVL